jgi:small-conductance mechanosensitive channel
MSDTVFSLLLILGALVLGAVISGIIAAVIRRKKKVFIVIEAGIFFAHLFRPLAVLVLAFCVFWGISFARLPQEVRGLLEYAIDLWMIGAAGWLMIKIVTAARDLILSRYDIQAKDNLQARSISTQVRLIEHILTTVIVFFTLAFMLMIIPKVRHIGVSLVASAGIAGIILGFAAQKTLGNFIAGIQLAFAQPIRIDDVVIVENEWGWIENITLTYVVVRIWDLRRLVVPISYFIEKPFQNWTRISADLLGTVFLYADYTVPVNEVREELTRILDGSPHWDKKVNVLQVTNADNRTVELRALMSAADSPTAWTLRCEVREKLLEFLQKKHPQSLPRVRVDLDEHKGGQS